jgi:LmbE family N-acetylglucosaminyl deacetylase
MPAEAAAPAALAAAPCEAWAALGRIALGRRPERPLRWAVVSAHPDDEILGAGALMARCPPRAVLLLTDGSPRDLAWAPAARRAGLSREEYARARREELAAALEVAGIPASRVYRLDGVDQEAAAELPALARGLADRLSALAPELVITHAYEGGHPDHDAAAFLVRAAAALLARRGAPVPELGEMTSYHAENGRLAIGQFLPPPHLGYAALAGASAAAMAALADMPPVELALGAAERERKRRMITCFATQEEVVRPFLPAAAERFRPAPPCRFDRPPHPGPLLYEPWGFPIDGARFRDLVRGAADELDLLDLAEGFAG